MSGVETIERHSSFALLIRRLIFFRYFPNRFRTIESFERDTHTELEFQIEIVVPEIVMQALADYAFWLIINHEMVAVSERLVATMTNDYRTVIMYDKQKIFNRVALLQFSFKT